jgi:hypothetical protein
MRALRMSHRPACTPHTRISLGVHSSYITSRACARALRMRLTVLRVLLIHLCTTETEPVWKLLLHMLGAAIFRQKLILLGVLERLLLLLERLVQLLGLV